MCDGRVGEKVPPQKRSWLFLDFNASLGTRRAPRFLDPLYSRGLEAVGMINSTPRTANNEPRAQARSCLQFRNLRGWIGQKGCFLAFSPLLVLAMWQREETLRLASLPAGGLLQSGLSPSSVAPEGIPGAVADVRPGEAIGCAALDRQAGMGWWAGRSQGGEHCHYDARDATLARHLIAASDPWRAGGPLLASPPCRYAG